MPKARPAHPTLRTFGRRIAALREQRDISQEDLAARAGIDRSYMSCIERGVRNTSVLKVAAIARALGVPIAALFERD